jgi:hypothetical protein
MTIEPSPQGDSEGSIDAGLKILQSAKIMEIGANLLTRN